MVKWKVHSHHDDGLSGGAIAGIVIGVVAFIGVLILGAVIYRSKKNSSALARNETNEVLYSSD